jgi:DNA helicase II / ATP-dependent DNA helicase PcrA
MMPKTQSPTSPERPTSVPAPESAVPPPSADQVGHPIVREEEAILQRVTDFLSTYRPSKPPPIENYEEQMLSIRDQMATARLEDIPALVEQVDRLQGIAARRAENVVEPVDPKAPYFGHIRLREEGRGERDVLIGKTTLVDAGQGIRIVDWRHAPVSQIYYKYEEGAEYEETFGEREVEGEVLVRRTVTIGDGSSAASVLLRGCS